MIRNYLKVLDLITTGLARSEGNHETPFGYDIAYILDNGSVKKWTSTWGKVGFTSGGKEGFKKAFLGIICIHKNPASFKRVIAEMLQATKDNPDLRVPVYNTNGNLIWPI